jgi:hypothetical protein
MSHKQEKAKPVRVRNRAQMLQAIDLRTAHCSYDQIGKSMGISKTRAYELVMAGMADLDASVKEAAEVLRAIEVRRCDAQAMKLWLQSGNPRVTDSILRVMERRARLLGLDAPQKVAQTTPDGDSLPPSLDLSKLTDEQLAALDAIYAAGAPQPTTRLDEV